MVTKQPLSLNHHNPTPAFDEGQVQTQQDALEQDHFLALQEISSRISAILDLGRLLDELIQRVMTTFGYYNVLIFLTDDKGEDLYLAASGRPLTREMQERRFKIGSGGLVGRAASAVISIFVPDVSECDFCTPSGPTILSEMAIPMLVGGLLVGVMDVESDQVGAFKEWDLQLMNTLANQVAASIKAIQLLQESRANTMALEQQTHTMMLISRISATLTSSLDASEILDRTVRHLVELSNTDYGGVFIMEQNKQHGLVLAEYPTRQLADQRFSYPRTSSSVQQMLKMGIPHVIEDAVNHPLLAPFREQIAPLDIRSLLLVPLVARSDMIGVLFLASLGQQRTFSGEELEICQTIASQAGVAVANARLLQDIQQQKRALARKTQELTEESSKLDVILRNIADGLVVTDNTGRIILSNPVFREMAGLTPDRSLRGFLLAGCFPVTGLQSLTVQALRVPGQVFTENLEMPDGRVLKASATAMRLLPTLLDPEQEKRIAGVATILRDITHEVEVDRMKTDFISTVSHELRSPLTTILGFTNLVQRDIRRSVASYVEADEEASHTIERILENLTIIENESQRLTRIVNDLLDVSKMEAGRIKWRMSKVSLDKVINGAVAATTALAEENDLSIQVYLPPQGLPPVYGNHDRLIQVMINLLSNAIKFTRRGRIEVRGWRLNVHDGMLDISDPAPPIYRSNPTAQKMLADLQFSAGEWVLVSITDTGIGIPVKSMPHIFEKFTQGGKVLTEKPKGTGLGLAICKEIIEYHKGLIWADSEQAQGSTFSFALPLRSQAPEDTPSIPIEE